MLVDTYRHARLSPTCFGVSLFFPTSTLTLRPACSELSFEEGDTLTFRSDGEDTQIFAQDEGQRRTFDCASLPCVLERFEESNSSEGDCRKRTKREPKENQSPGPALSA